MKSIILAAAIFLADEVSQAHTCEVEGSDGSITVEAPIAQVDTYEQCRDLAFEVGANYCLRLPIEEAEFHTVKIKYKVASTAATWNFSCN